MKKLAIIFGGSGFIGGHLLQKLEKAQLYDELWICDLTEGPRKYDNSRFFECDVRLPINLFVNGDPIVDIFNLAAVHRTPGHQTDEYYETNVMGALNVCEFARNIGARTVTFTSSIAVYGPTEERVSEDSIPKPVSAYGKSKLLAEKVHRDCLQRSGESATKLRIVRPGVIYGQGENGNFTRLAASVKEGRFFYPGSMNTVKSCGYVKELVNSIVFMNDNESQEVLYNFCFTNSTTVKEICEAMSKVLGVKPPSLILPLPVTKIAAIPFEVLNYFGFQNGINRERVMKLVNSTDIYPRVIQEIGYEFKYSLSESIADWYIDACELT